MSNRRVITGSRVKVILLGILAAVGFASSSRAQEIPAQNQIELPPESIAALDTICSNLVGEIQSRHFDSVAVFGASWNAQEYTELGDAVGDAASSHLAAMAAGFKVIGRDALRSMLESDRISPFMADSAFSAQWLAAEVRIPAVVLVTLTDWKDSSITVHLLLMDNDPSHRNSLAGWKFDLSLSPSLLASLHHSILTDDLIATPLKQKRPKGASANREFPECDSCPRPNYTPDARSRRWEGGVLLSALVTTDGAATEILVLQGAPYLIDKVAISALKTWKFKPALDSNKIPVAKRVQIILTFQLG